MKSRWWIAAELAFMAVLWAGGFLWGRRDEHARMQTQYDAAIKLAADRDLVAQGWQAKAQQSEPLIRQWRMGYEQLQKTCGPR